MWTTLASIISQLLVLWVTRCFVDWNINSNCTQAMLQDWPFCCSTRIASTGKSYRSWISSKQIFVSYWRVMNCMVQYTKFVYACNIFVTSAYIKKVWNVRHINVELVYNADRRIKSSGRLGSTRTYVDSAPRVSNKYVLRVVFWDIRLIRECMQVDL